MKRKIIILVCLLAVSAGITVSAAKIKEVSKADTADEENAAGKTEEISNQIKETYSVSNQAEIAQELEKKKSAGTYTAGNMLTVYNPFGTNTQSMYVYFTTAEAVSVSYTIHVEDESIGDFSRSVYQDESYEKEHEFQLIGLVPDMINEITFTLTREDGTVTTEEMSYEMGSLLGTEKVQLDMTAEGDAEKLEDGLYVVLGNDSSGLDFMYYYDNEGVLRGEVPILGYRSHRIIFDEDSMYYSISETKMARVNRLGQVVNVYNLEGYELHHDYVFDDDGNILILASDETQDSVEDIVVRLDVDSGEIEEVLDLEDLFGSYKEECTYSDDGELDWMHINTIQWMGEDSVLLSSRETSSVIKVENLYEAPEVSYIIGSVSFWEETGYEEFVLEQDGDFTVQGGQHSVTYVEDDSLKDGQYYLYMYNNNIGLSKSNPDYDWSSVGLVEDSAKGGESSYYYEYLVDEEAGTFELADSFSVPYSGYVSSAQNLMQNTVIDCGMQGVFAEYDEDHDLIASYEMEVETFIYRVYKYRFEGFYFRAE